MTFLRHISFVCFIFCASVFSDGTHYLKTFPEAGRAPYLDLIQGTQNNLSLTAYALDDAAIIAALKEAATRGVHIRLLYEPKMVMRNSKVDGDSKKVMEDLTKAGISVKPFNLSRAAQLHAKYFIADNGWAMVSSQNLDAESFDGVQDEVAPTRDFAIMADHPDHIKALQAGFDADWDNTVFPYKLAGDMIIWGPEGQRKKFVDLINKAHNTLSIYQIDITDVGLYEALLAAIKRGVKVRLLMQPYPFNKNKDYNIPHQKNIMSAGGEIRLMQQYYMHAKVAMADFGQENQVFYMGSCNFYTPSIDKNRELGFQLSFKNIYGDLHSTFEDDWALATPFSASKKG